MGSKVLYVCGILILCFGTMAVAQAHESWEDEVAYMQENPVVIGGLGWADIGDFDSQLELHIGLRWKDKWQAKFGWAKLEGDVRSGWSTYTVDDDYWYVMGSRIWRIPKNKETDEYEHWYVGAGLGWHFADADLKHKASGRRAGCRKYSLAGHILVGYDFTEDWNAELYWVFGSDIWDWDIDGVRLVVSRRFE